MRTVPVPQNKLPWRETTPLCVVLFGCWTTLDCTGEHAQVQGALGGKILFEVHDFE